jgi:hypothetical protein
MVEVAQSDNSARIAVSCWVWIKIQIQKAEENEEFVCHRKK